MNDLKEIGFYTLNNIRAVNCSYSSPIARLEIILTHRCNFKCPYCRGMLKDDQVDLSFDEVLYIINLCKSRGLKNIRFSGGEPTLWNGLEDLIRETKKVSSIERIAISTNGSADKELYEKLIRLGVNDISISLDSCCSSTGSLMSGNKNDFEKLKKNIEYLSKLTYVTIGIVITDTNIDEINDIIKLSYTLGVSDIRVITSAQSEKKLPKINIENKIINKYPILKYRINNLYTDRSIRGLIETDYNKCPLVLDDLAVMNNKHYPCVIYLREHGKEIGKITSNIFNERIEWYKNHDAKNDPICKNNCLDACVDYNNKVRDNNININY